MEALDQLIKQRLAKLEALRASGADPYRTAFERDGSVGQLLERFEENKSAKTAGRITALRAHGKTTFADLRDQTGKIQLVFSEEALKERYPQLAELDLGDIVGVSGVCLTTRTQERSIQVEEFQLLAKAIRPLPEKWHGLKDVELRYRKRYLDLLGNPATKEAFVLRTRLVSGIRRFLDERGFLEMETPMMQPIPGGAAGKPFKTHHNALGMDLYLRIAPELYLKRLLVGGFDKVYEINRSFRNEGLSTRHNPEFTMLEVYEAYGHCESMIQLTEKMVTGLAQELLGKTELEFEGKKINLTRPWKRVSFAELAERDCGIKPTDTIEVMVKKLGRKGKVTAVELNQMGSSEYTFSAGGTADLDESQLKTIPKNKLAKFVMRWLDELFTGDKGAPIFVTEFFQLFSPLAKSHPSKPGIADRFELFMGGIEVANAYSEQNDPIVQRERLYAYKEVGGEEAQTVDEDFLEALEYAMPPAGGLGIGIDRLTMLFSGRDTIRDVILFPTLKPGDAHE